MQRRRVSRIVRQRQSSESVALLTRSSERVAQLSLLTANNSSSSTRLRLETFRRPSCIVSYPSLVRFVYFFLLFLLLLLLIPLPHLPLSPSFLLFVSFIRFNAFLTNCASVGPRQPKRGKARCVISPTSSQWWKLYELDVGGREQGVRKRARLFKSSNRISMSEWVSIVITPALFERNERSFFVETVSFRSRIILGTAFVL